VGWLANVLGPRRAVCIEGLIGILAAGVFVLYKKRQAMEDGTGHKTVLAA
jgi:hypothetical protein